MATSEVQICSNALLLLGDDTINSFEDEADRVTLVSNLFPTARDAVLRLHPWNCALKRVALAPEVTTYGFDWQYSFLLPDDWIRTVSVGMSGEETDYEIENGRILCDENPCYLRYIFRNEVVASYDALLVETITAYMAWKIAYPITKSSTLRDSKEKEFGTVLKLAQNADGQESPPQEIRATRYRNSRY